MHYLIRTLVTRGYIQRCTDGRHYLLALRFGNVASASLAELNLRTSVGPYLREITTRFNLTATATVLRNAQAVIVDRAISHQDVEGGSWIGRHLDLHCTSHGKALISALSDEKLERLFCGRELACFTPKTISTLTALKTHLALVRAEGHAVDDEEQVVGIRAVAVPVTDPIGASVVSVSVRGTTDQIPSSRLLILGRELSLVAREISRR